MLPVSFYIHFDRSSKALIKQLVTPPKARSTSASPVTAIQQLRGCRSQSCPNLYQPSKYTLKNDESSIKSAMADAKSASASATGSSSGTLSTYTSTGDLEIVNASAASSSPESNDQKDSNSGTIPVIDSEKLVPVLDTNGNPVVIGEGTFGKVYLRRYRKKLVIEKRMTNKKGNAWTGQLYIVNTHIQ